MVITTTVFICILNFVNLLKKNRYRLPITLVVIILWLIMGANTKNPDFYTYSINYVPNRIGSDVGYSLLIKIFSSIGFSYSTFRMIISFMGIFLISRTINKLVINKSAFYLLYLLYPFIIDVVQIRNFLVMSILIYSIPYLLTESKTDRIKFGVFILIASTLQLTAIFYLPILFIEKIRKNNLLKIIISSSIFMIIMVSINKPLLNEFSQVLLQLGDFDQRILIYSKIQTNYGFLLLWVLQLSSFLLVLWANRILRINNYVINAKKIEHNNQVVIKRFKETENRYLGIIKWINIYAFLFLPFYVFQITFARLLRNIIPLNIIAFLIVEQSLTRTGKRNYWFRFAYLCFHIFMIWIDLTLIYPNIDVYEILMNNWFF